MKISKKSWVMKVAYGDMFSNMPTTTSFCKIFWAFWLGLLLGWPGTIAFWVLKGIYINVLHVPLAFLFGYRKILVTNQYYGGSHVEEAYSLGRIGNHRIVPAGWLAIAWALGSTIRVVLAVTVGPNPFAPEFPGLYSAAVYITGKIVIAGVGILVVGAVVIGFVALVCLACKKSKDSDFGRMILGYLKALKEKACPIVRVE